MIPGPKQHFDKEGTNGNNLASASPLTLDIERSGDQVVVRCHGKLLAGVCEDLYAKVRLLIPDSKCIVLDLTDPDSHGQHGTRQE